MNVRKCCRVGDFFDEKTYGCMAGGGDTKAWLPQIYLINRKTLWNSTDKLPKHMVLLEDERPSTCLTPVVISKDFVIASNGSLLLPLMHEIVSPEDFCFDRKIALACTKEAKDPSNIKKPKTDAIRKCCAPESVYLSVNKTCALLPDIKSLAMQVFDRDMYDIIYTFPACQEPVYAIIGEFDSHNIINGTKIGYKINGDQTFTSDQFCVESTYQDGTQKVHLFTCSEHVSVSSEKAMDEMQTRFAIYSIGLFISAGFLAATLIIGFLTPSNHHIMHWKCQTYYIACLLVGEILLAVTQLMKSGTGGWGCFTMAVCMHFFFLAAFFWLNTMCFNIWWTFR